MLLLSDLKQRLQENSRSMKELQLTYQEDPKTIYAMLKHFILRGQVKEETITPKCGSRCQECDPMLTLKFEWVTQ